MKYFYGAHSSGVIIWNIPSLPLLHRTTQLHHFGGALEKIHPLLFFLPLCLSVSPPRLPHSVPLSLALSVWSIFDFLLLEWLPRLNTRAQDMQLRTALSFSAIAVEALAAAAADGQQQQQWGRHTLCSQHECWRCGLHRLAHKISPGEETQEICE